MNIISIQFNILNYLQKTEHYELVEKEQKYMIMNKTEYPVEIQLMLL